MTPGSLVLGFHGNVDDAGPHHAERASRYVDDAPANKGTTIIDPAVYRRPGASNSYDTAQWSGAMSAGHFPTMTSPSVIGGETGFGFARGSRWYQKGSNQRGSIHPGLKRTK